MLAGHASLPQGASILYSFDFLLNIAFGRGGGHLPIALATPPAVHPGITIWVDEIEKIRKKMWPGEFFCGGGANFLENFEVDFLVFTRK